MNHLCGSVVSLHPKVFTGMLRVALARGSDPLMWRPYLSLIVGVVCKVPSNKRIEALSLWVLSKLERHCGALN